MPDIHLRDEARRAGRATVLRAELTILLVLLVFVDGECGNEPSLVLPGPPSKDEELIYVSSESYVSDCLMT